MRYLSIFTPAPQPAGTPMDPEVIRAMDKLVADSMKAGTLVYTGGLVPIARGGVRVRSEGRKIGIADGPYSEAKELVGGFAILEARDRDHVTQLAREFLGVCGDGQCDIYPIMGPDDVC